MTKSTIAICVSGQIRTPLDALIEIAKEAEAINADLFVSVWSQLGGKTFGGAVGPKNIQRIVGRDAALFLPDNWLGRMREVFPKSDDYFPKRSAFTERDISSILPNAVIEVEDDSPDYDLNTSDSNSLRMLYKIWRANQLKRESEILRKRRYEKVIRVRPDMLFNGDVIQRLDVSSNAFFVQNHVGHRPNYINDTIWVASSVNDDVLSDLYLRCDRYKNSGWKGIHRELSDVAKRSELTATAANVVKSGIGNFGMEIDPEPSVGLVRDNLFSAVVSQDFETKIAGGNAFCDLVSHVVSTGKAKNEYGEAFEIDKKSLDLLSIVQKENPKFYFNALLYLLNVSLLDPTLSTTDRIEAFFRVMSYYLFRNALVYLEVRAENLAELVDHAPIDIQEAICSQGAIVNVPSAKIIEQICVFWDANWAKHIDSDPIKSRTQVSINLLRNLKLVVHLHQVLSRGGNHEEAFDLAEKRVRLVPENWRGYDLKAASAKALGNFSLALSIYQEAEKSVSPHNRIHEMKGRLLIELGRLDEAQKELNYSLSLPGCNTKRVSSILENLSKIQ